MKRIFVFLACTGALILAGCTSESKLPNPTGKGGVRAINAIPGAPGVSFRIEERLLDSLVYKASSKPVLYDDFEYIFNFDINVPGQSDQLRIVSVTQKIDVDREYVFALTGSVDTPTVTTWATDLRDWSGSETVFEARFAHLSLTLGDIDVYFDDPANPLSPTNLVATLSYGEIMDVADFEEGTYSITITAAGDPNRIPLYASGELTFNAQSSQLLSIFDGNENDTSPYVVMAMSAAGQAQRFPDPSFPPTIRFVNGARTLGTVDAYQDELLTDFVVGNLALGTATNDILTDMDAKTYYFTPAGSTATTLFSEDVGSPPPSTPTELVLIGTTDLWQGVNLTQDRSSVSTAAKLTIFHAAFNVSAFDIYVKDRDAPLEENDIPTFFRVIYSLPSPTALLAAGSFDLYITENATKNVIAGPYALDLALGDVVFLLGTDDVDPTKVEIRDISLP